MQCDVADGDRLLRVGFQVADRTLHDRWCGIGTVEAVRRRQVRVRKRCQRRRVDQLYEAVVHERLGEHIGGGKYIK